MRREGMLGKTEVHVHSTDKALFSLAVLPNNLMRTVACCSRTEARD